MYSFPLFTSATILITLLSNSSTPSQWTLQILSDFLMEGHTVRREEVTLPKATMTKIIKEMLPKDVRVSKDAQDMIMECSLEFINLISSEANDICSKGDKKTIAPEHVIEALQSLGFSSYLSEVQAAYEQHRAESLESPRATSRWPAKNNVVSTGMTEEEAIAEQQKMFAEARAAMNSSSFKSTTSDPPASVVADHTPDEIHAETSK